MHARSSIWIGALLVVVAALMAACGGGGTATPDVVMPPDPPSDAPAWASEVGCQCQVSEPPNGTHFVPGDEPVIWVAFFDDAGNPLTQAELSTANLYMYGPQEQAKTTTAAALLRASTDRSASTHHYINLLTNPEVVWDGNVISYPLSAVTNELPGTYAVTVWNRRASDNLQQWMPVDTCQIGTAVAETQIVEREKCAACHKGSESGKYYLHHIDPGYSPTGNHSLDSWPVRTCKSCHNQNGYAGFNNGTGSGDNNIDRTPDPIVRRVHGVHMGADLKSPFNIDPNTGDFRDYIHVEFPADVRNCTMCHVDDRWKTQPARLACGACHDSVWFGDAAATPVGWTSHPGGAQANDDNCAGCHPADTGGAKPISVAHAIAPPTLEYTVELTMTPAGNGTHYVAGEAPVVTIIVKDSTTQQPIDHTTINETTFGRAYLFVSGPRALTMPVLTTSAVGGTRAYARNSVDAPWNIDGLAFDVSIDGTLWNLVAPVSAAPGAATQAEVVAWLNAALAPFATATPRSSAQIQLTSNTTGLASSVEIHASPVATTMGWTVGFNGPPPNYYARNDIRDHVDPYSNDPKVTRFTDRLEYQLDPIVGLASGTYTLFSYVRPPSNVTHYALEHFQIGTDTVGTKPATSCTDCHADTLMHGAYPFNPDICKNCHDYKREGTGYGWAGAPPNGTSGTSTSGWSGFGAKPLAARIHGVHRGHYLDYPEDVKPPYRPHYDFSEVIFPQDIRNCTKCHSESSTWTQKPSRLTCLACHDSDAAAAHGAAMTIDPTPADPWSGDEDESCDVCHGEDKPWTPYVAHNVWNPYAPPYRREK